MHTMFSPSVPVEVSFEPVSSAEGQASLLFGVKVTFADAEVEVAETDVALGGGVEDVAACDVEGGAVPSVKPSGQVLAPLEKVPFSAKYSQLPAVAYTHTVFSPSFPVDLSAEPVSSFEGQLRARLY